MDIQAVSMKRKPEDSAPCDGQAAQPGPREVIPISPQQVSSSLLTAQLSAHARQPAKQPRHGEWTGSARLGQPLRRADPMAADLVNAWIAAHSLPSGPPTAALQLPGLGAHTGLVSPIGLVFPMATLLQAPGADQYVLHLQQQLPLQLWAGPAASTLHPSAMHTLHLPGMPLIQTPLGLLAAALHQQQVPRLALGDVTAPLVLPPQAQPLAQLLCIQQHHQQQQDNHHQAQEQLQCAQSALGLQSHAGTLVPGGAGSVALVVDPAGEGDRAQGLLPWSEGVATPSCQWPREAGHGGAGHAAIAVPATPAVAAALSGSGLPSPQAPTTASHKDQRRPCSEAAPAAGCNPVHSGQVQLEVAGEGTPSAAGGSPATLQGPSPSSGTDTLCRTLSAAELPDAAATDTRIGVPFQPLPRLEQQEAALPPATSPDCPQPGGKACPETSAANAMVASAELPKPPPSRAASSASSLGTAPEFEYVVRNGADVMVGARCVELPGVRQALEAQDPLSRDIMAGVLQLAEQKVEASEEQVQALLERLDLDGEQPQGAVQDGLHTEPGAVSSLMLRSMVNLAVTGMEGGLLLPDTRRGMVERQIAELRREVEQGRQRQHARQGTRGSALLAETLAALEQRLPPLVAAARRVSRKRPGLSAKVVSNFRRLQDRMAATLHGELRTRAASQAEVAQQLQQCGALEDRDWVQVVQAPTQRTTSAGVCADQAACMLGSEGGGYLTLEGGKCSVSGHDGQQVFTAQPTDCRRVVAFGRAQLLLLQLLMEQHRQLMGGDAPWSPANPAHQGLYWLALGMALPRRQACKDRVGYYHPEILLHSDAMEPHLGGALHPSLAPPTSSACSGCHMLSSGYDVELSVAAESQAGFDPGSWPWQNCTAWSLTDQLCGPLLRALGERGGPLRLPMLPGITCSFGIVTTSASLAIHVEDFCGGSTNMCWAGFKFWMFIPPEVLESNRSLVAKLTSKELPPEWVLASAEILPHVQLALQLPGQLMIIKPGKAYHGVSVPGFCLAEAANHWHPLQPAVHSVEEWLQAWCELKTRSSAAWQTRMRPLWFFFYQLRELLEGCVHKQRHPLSEEGCALARAINHLLKLKAS